MRAGDLDNGTVNAPSDRLADSGNLGVALDKDTDKPNEAKTTEVIAEAKQATEVIAWPITTEVTLALALALTRTQNPHSPCPLVLATQGCRALALHSHLNRKPVALTLAC